MPTPSKPYLTLVNEKKSHRTKAELTQRMQAERATTTSYILHERAEVRENPIAHKEFKRLNNLLKKINKSDAIYENVINRYCMIHAECFDMEIRKKKCDDFIDKIEERFDESIDKAPVKEAAEIIKDYTKAYSEAIKNLTNCDSLIQKKRKMLFDIERDNLMTIAAALRSVPKKQEKKSQLREALKNSG